MKEIIVQRFSLHEEPEQDIHTKAEQEAMLTVYEQICKTYHSIDDFRTKLIGYLPLSSLLGIFLLNKDSLWINGTGQNVLSTEPITFASAFASLLTLALFSYEIRGIQRSHNLIKEGEHIEKALHIRHGQFQICCKEHENKSPITRFLNAKLAACAIYLLVFAAWLSIALKFGLGINTLSCCISAILVGTVITVVVLRLIRNLIAP
jgi:hypothetical protein